MSTDNVAAPDTASAPEKLRALMRACVDATTGRPKFPLARPTSAMEIIAAGGLLIGIKAELGHGEFIRWVEAECPFSYRTAHRYMRIARLFMKSDTVADLGHEERSNL
jgi:hypothetical protein